MTDLNLAYIGPWGENSHNWDNVLSKEEHQNAKMKIIVNGHNSILATLDGGDYIPYHNVKNRTDFAFLEKYDAVIIPYWGGFYQFIVNIKKANPNVKICGIGDFELNALPQGKHDFLVLMVQAAKACDWLLASNRDTIDLLKSFKPDAVFTGWSCYPSIHFPLIVETAKKDKMTIALGCANTGSNRNILSNFCAFKRILEKYPKMHGFYFNVHPDWVERIDKLANELGIPKESISLVQEMPWEEFLEHLSKCYLGLHLYTWHVMNRFAQDCAALKIPLVGCDANFINRVCFPYISFPPYQIERPVQAVFSLLESDEMYKKYQQIAFEKIQIWSREAVKNRILEVITKPKESNNV